MFAADYQQTKVVSEDNCETGGITFYWFFIQYVHRQLRLDFICAHRHIHVSTMEINWFTCTKADFLTRLVIPSILSPPPSIK